MVWVVLGLALFYILGFVQGVKRAYGGGTTVTINAGEETISAAILAVVSGFSFCLFFSRILAGMNWFFMISAILSALTVIVRLMTASRHGTKRFISASSHASSAIIGLLLAAGFFYVFFILLQAR